MKAKGARKKKEAEFNPGRKGGRRNIFCPHYSECLDFVVEEQWVSWGCKHCRYRYDESGRAELEPRTDQVVPYYEVNIRI